MIVYAQEKGVVRFIAFGEEVTLFLHGIEGASMGCAVRAGLGAACCCCSQISQGDANGKEGCALTCTHTSSWETVGLRDFAPRSLTKLMLLPAPSESFCLSF